MRKFEYKYKIDEEKRTIVAMSTFAGKVVTGVARCAPGDEFDIETGKKIAAARCSLKIAEKRLKRAETCNAIAADEFEYWSKRKAQMENYEFDAVQAYKAAVENLTTLKKVFASNM
jgi:hypothetical protein